MKISPLLSAITRSAWAIDPVFAVNNAQLVNAIINGKKIDAQEKTISDLISFHAPVAAEDENDHVNYSYVGDYTNIDNLPYNSVAVVKIFGPLMKHDDWCSYGMASIGERIKRIDAHPNVSAIVLHMDTPGGTVDGTPDLARIIHNTQKPTLVFGDGLVASGGVWLAVHADEIWMNDTNAEIGSVGVMMSFWDTIPYYEKEGFKYHQLVSSLSPDKTKMFDDLRAGKYANYIKDKLDPLAIRFQETVKEKRPLVTPEHLTGSVFFAKDVLGSFVDKIGTLEEAIVHASDLAAQAKANSNSNQNNTNASAPALLKSRGSDTKNSTQNLNTMEKYPLIQSVLGTEFEIDAEGHTSFNSDQLDSIEAAIKERDDTKAQVTDVTNKLNDANASIDTITQERDNAISERDTVAGERDQAKNDLQAAKETITERDNSIAELEKKIPGASDPNHKASDDSASESNASEVSAEDKELEKIANMSIAERVAYFNSQEKK